ncbi:MAG: glycosyltransferase family 4 protein [Acidithiobacillus sp.]
MTADRQSVISVNSRILSYPMTGVPRYLKELLQRMPESGLRQISPDLPLSGIRAHLWEQSLLPLRARGNLLWSPGNAGPLTISKQVVTIHDVVSLDHPEWLNPRFAAWYRFLTPKLARRVRRVITVSEFTKIRLLETTGISEEKIIVIPLGVDPRFAPMDQTNTSEIAKKLGLRSDHYVLSLGSLEPRKNLGRLLRAWEIVSDRLPTDIWLVVSGAKGNRMVFQDVPELKKLPDRVFLTGRVADEDLPKLYAGAMAFAYPSVYEGFGLPPLEAMASGAPTLVGNCASLPEVVGDAAVRVDPFDIEAIAEGLLRLLEDDTMRTKLRANGLKRVAQFNWERTAAQTWQVLVEAAEE